MRKRTIFAFFVCAALVALAVWAQQPDAIIKIQKGEMAAVAVPDMRGTGEAQQFMNAFNQTLWDDLSGAGVFRMVPKSLYPLEVPQRPEDFRAPITNARGQQTRQGPWLTDWSGPPVSASFLAFGYTAVQSGRLVLFGYFYNVTQNDLANAQVIGRLYFGTVDEEGARKVARDFAADILQQFGAQSLSGTRIFFVSTRTGGKEIWSMDHDGQNQKQITSYRSISINPTVSLDGKRLAFTSFTKGNPRIFMYSLETGRFVPFYNQVASMNATPAFTPDGSRVLFSSTASGRAQLYISNLDGGGISRLTNSSSIDVEPKVNPKTGTDIVFVSGRSGPPQIYRMSMDGASVERLTTGEGEAVNPAWHPDGQFIAFSWTRGFAPGNYNIFVMDVATRRFSQLTHGAGRNENPGWAPDGRHIVFSSNRTGSTQIWSMLADGTQLRQLTSRGNNDSPVWSK
jgi:TolB protein